MAEETLGASWAETTPFVEQELTAWRRAHQRPTLTEIELAVEAATARWPARLITDLAQEVGEAAEQPAVCPARRGRLERRGRRLPAVVTARQAQPPRLVEALARLGAKLPRPRARKPPPGQVSLFD